MFRDYAERGKSTWLSRKKTYSNTVPMGRMLLTPSTSGVRSSHRRTYHLWLLILEESIGQEVNVIHKRHLPPTFTFTDLPHHRTCRSAYGGFVLLHLTVCDKLFSAIPSRYVTSILLSDSVLSCEQRVPFRTSDYKRLSRQQSFTVALHDSVLPYRQPVSWVL